jgi:hypothetical protein
MVSNAKTFEEGIEGLIFSPPNLIALQESYDQIGALPCFGNHESIEKLQI